MVDERIAQQAHPSDERRYRAGRGGYDPELAAQLAQAKYVFRQRVVVGLALGTLVTVVLAYTVSGLLWWVHAALDLSIVSYLGYLRRQVRIEDEVRQRRAARLAGSRPRPSIGDTIDDSQAEVVDNREEAVHESRSAEQPSAVHASAVALDFDDEDPIFDELQPAFEPPYRRAVGE